MACWVPSAARNVGVPEAGSNVTFFEPGSLLAPRTVLRAPKKIVEPKAAIAEGKAFAAKAPGGVTSMADFIKLYGLWTADGALEIEVLEASDRRFDFNVTRCKYAETYREMGLGPIGHLMSCNRDGTFCEGYDPNIKLERKETIMAGAPCCTFRYTYESGS